MRVRSFLSRVFGTQLALPLFQAKSSAAARPLERISPSRPPEAVVPEYAERELRAKLEETLRKPVSVKIHNNRSTMISFRQLDDRLHLRLHRMFLAADATVVSALADFAGRRGRRSGSGALLDSFIKAHQGEIRQGRLLHSDPRGRFHDLEATFGRLNVRFFEGAIQASIGWGRLPRGNRRRRHTIKMGLYFHEQKAIRIHPALDRPQVPGYVVEFIVYHEMLHQACPPERTPQGKQRIHTRAFRAREKLHPDHQRALAWEKQHLKMLLRPQRNGD
jgi:hypothetical protein